MSRTKVPGIETMTLGNIVADVKINTLTNWEVSFGKALQRVEIVKRRKAGTLLSAIPNHVEWDNFLESARSEWWTWRRDLRRYPSCLVVLYGGLAFYEYEDNTLWHQFALAIGS